MIKKGREKKKKDKNFKKIIYALVGLGLLSIFLMAWFLKDVPSPKKLSDRNNFSEASQVFDRNGKLLYKFYADKNRVFVSLDQIPENLIEATLAIEDASFYKHLGFDVKGLLRGLSRTIVKKRLQGGSTITQQLVKNALLSPERTLKRKVKEAVLTMVVEIMYDKEEILEMYFNQTPYGGTMWGVEAAAKGIFNKKPSDLSLAEVALIAGLPASPTKYSPFTNPDQAKLRQKLVLWRMQELSMITEEERRTAEDESLSYFVERSEMKAPHFVFEVKDRLVEDYGLSKLLEGGLKVTTSLDLDVQEYSEKIVKEEISDIEKYNVTNGAVVITEAKTGQVLAMIGSKDYWSEDIDGNFNVATALRQPGSSIKPIAYATALELGKINLATVFDDNPVCFLVPGQRDYCPTNYGYAYHGIQSARNSLGNSLNIPAVKTIKLTGVEAMISTASAMGITSFEDPVNYGLSLALGGGEVKMVDMNVAFGVFANEGTRQDLNYILKVEDKNGKVLFDYSWIPGVRAISRETAFLIQHVLSDDGARGMVFGRGSKLNIKDHPEVAVKTGTTNNLRDNWTIGFSPDYVVTVWVGNNNNTRMRGVASGTTGATPIWNRVMTKLLEGKTVKKAIRPVDIVGMNVCNLTGGLVPEEGCDARYEYFNNKFKPTEVKSLKRPVLVDKDKGFLTTEVNPNSEWREQSVVEDATGVLVCIDCPAETNEEGKITPKRIE